MVAKTPDEFRQAFGFLWSYLIEIFIQYILYIHDVNRVKMAYFMNKIRFNEIEPF